MVVIFPAAIRRAMDEIWRSERRPSRLFFFTFLRLSALT
jgi:hypothetical protein